MKDKAILIATVLACLSLASVAQEITNTPVRMVISKFSQPPPMEKMEITDTNTISRIVALFPGYEKQPEPLTGSWETEYIVDLYWANGKERCIYVVENEWSAGQEEYTPLVTNWASVLRQMTNAWSRTPANKAY